MSSVVGTMFSHHLVLYHCEIPTDDGDLVRETVYMGIYGSGGTDNQRVGRLSM